MGRMDEALAMWHREVELDPLSPHLHYRLGLLHMGVGQYDLAIEKYTNVLELDHRHSMAHFNIGYCNIKKGNVDEGIRSSETAARLMKRSPLALGRLGAAYAQGGKIGEARGLLDKLLGLAQKTYVPASAFALIYCALGEIDKGLAWVEKAFEDRDPSIPVFFAVYRMHEPLRSHPRYHALLRKMNLEP